MLIKENLGNLAAFNDKGRAIDRLPLEWYETSKRILHKRTVSDREVVLKFLKEAPNLQQDDVLYADENSLIVVEVLACEAIVIKPTTMYEMAYVCYEIGNKHLPLFYEEETLLIPFDEPVFKMLKASGMKPFVQRKKLLHPLRTTVSPHSHSSSGESLFTKILKLTTTTSNE